MMFLAIVAMMPFALTSCTDDDNAGGEPVITAVRRCDPAKADSTFTKSPQGQAIAIIGKNLQNTLYVYINDQKVYFNPTMNTDHSIIVIVPSESKGFQLTAFNSDLKDEIRVETSHGTARYAFKVCGAYPQIDRIQGEYPRKAGDILNIYGLNLYDIEKMFITDATTEDIETAIKDPAWDNVVPGNRVEVADYSIIKKDRNLDNNGNYIVDSYLTAVTPSLPFDAGTLVIETAAGRTYIPYTKTPGMPVILSCSSDMPVVGEELVIKGREFVQLQSIQYGDIVLDPSEYKVAESEDEITIDFTRLPTVGSEATLSVTTPGGTVTIPFFDPNSLLFNLDDVEGANRGWDPKATTETVTPGVAPFTASGNYAHMYVESEVGPQWWGTMIFYGGMWDNDVMQPFTLPTNIPDNAPASNVYLAMEVFDNNSGYNNDGTGFSGYLRYSIFPTAGDCNADDQTAFQYNNFDWEDYNAGKWFNKQKILADVNGNAYKGKWYRHVVSLENFPIFEGKTYAEIKAIGINDIRIQSVNQHTATGRVDVCFDNFRLIYLP